MSRPAPNLEDRTPEEDFLAAIANPWRRELVRWCLEPRSKRDVFREFVCAGKKQRYTGLAALVETGWLRDQGETYVLNPAAPMELSRLIGVTVGQNLLPFDFDQGAACDAAIAALRRQSCRRIIAMLEHGPAKFGELREFAGVHPRDFLFSCTTLKHAYALREDGRSFSLTGAGFPALEHWLNRISVTSAVAA